MKVKSSVKVSRLTIDVNTRFISPPVIRLLLTPAGIRKGAPISPVPARSLPSRTTSILIFSLENGTVRYWRQTAIYFWRRKLSASTVANCSISLPNRIFHPQSICVQPPLTNLEQNWHPVCCEWMQDALPDLHSTSESKQIFSLCRRIDCNLKI